MNNPFETDERRAFRENLRAFIAKEIAPHADVWDEAGEIPWEVHEKFGAFGVWGFGVDEKYGMFLRVAGATKLIPLSTRLQGA